MKRSLETEAKKAFTMSQPAITNIEDQQPPSGIGIAADNAAIDFMGPARVLQVSGDRVVARRSDGAEVDVRMAMALAYRPVQGDLLLVVGGAEGDFALGVLEGTGQSSLAIAGDLELHAVGGELSLRGDRGLRLQSPEVAVVTDKFKLFADTAVQKVSTLAQSVRDLWTIKTKRAHIAVDDELHQRSKTATVLTEEEMVFNGKTIHIG